MHRRSTSSLQQAQVASQQQTKLRKQNRQQLSRVSSSSMFQNVPVPTQANTSRGLTKRKKSTSIDQDGFKFQKHGARDDMSADRLANMSVE